MVAQYAENPGEGAVAQKLGRQHPAEAGRVDGRGGTDQVDYSRSPAGVDVSLNVGTAEDGHGGTDTLTGIVGVRGSDLADAITGNGADNRLEGRAGGDILDGRGGDDELDGGDGRDSLIGGKGGDVLTGGAGADSLDGNRGSDVLDGGDGDDLLLGGIGPDTVTGGEGTDTFRYASISQGIDTITDLEDGDPIDLACWTIWC